MAFLAQGCSLVLELDPPAEVVGRGADDGGLDGPRLDAFGAGDGGSGGGGGGGPEGGAGGGPAGGFGGAAGGGGASDAFSDFDAFDAAVPDGGSDAEGGAGGFDGGPPDDAGEADGGPAQPGDLTLLSQGRSTILQLRADGTLGGPLTVNGALTLVLRAPVPPGLVVLEGLDTTKHRATLFVGLEGGDVINLRPNPPRERADLLGRTRVEYAQPEPVAAQHDVTIGCFGALIDPPGGVEFDVYSDCVGGPGTRGEGRFSVLALALNEDHVPVAFTHAAERAPADLARVVLPAWREDFRRLDLDFAPSADGITLLAHAALMRHELRFGTLVQPATSASALVGSRIRLPLATDFGEEAIDLWFTAERTQNGLVTVRKFATRLEAVPERLGFELRRDLPPEVQSIDPPGEDPRRLGWRLANAGGTTSAVWARAFWDLPEGVTFEWRVLAPPGTRNVQLPRLPEGLDPPLGRRRSLEVTALHCDAAEAGFADVRNGACPLAHRPEPPAWRGTVRTSSALAP